MLAPLSQHFEPSEVALLARCLCVPLVSVRVGKIDKQGNLMCPTSTRGNITLTLLPTSNLCISLVDDDGRVERLGTISIGSGSSCTEIEEIPSDQSGRSFVLKIAGSKDLYFWSSERSKLLGDKLLEKVVFKYYLSKSII